MEIKYTIRAMDFTSPTVEKVTGQIRKMNKVAGQEGTSAFGKLTNGLGGALGKLGGLVAGFGVATVAFRQFMGGLRDSIRIEKNLAEVQTLLGEVRMDVDATKAALLNLGVESGQGIDHLTKALYDSVSAGIAFEDSMSFLSDASTLAVGGLTDISVTVDHLTSVVNAYGLAVSDVSDVNDAIFTAVKGGKTTVAELSAEVGKLAPVAKSAGLSIDELYASIATVTKTGLSTQMAATGIRAALVALLAPGAEAASEFKRLGVNISSQRIEAEGLVPVLQDLYKATGNNFEAMQKLVPSVEALPALLALTADGAKEMGSQMEAMAKKTGAAEKAAAEMAKTTEIRLNRLAAAWTKYKQAQVEAFRPLVGKAADFLRGLLELSSKPVEVKVPETIEGQIAFNEKNRKRLLEDIRLAKADQDYEKLDDLAQRLTGVKSALADLLAMKEEARNFTVAGVIGQVEESIKDVNKELSVWKTHLSGLEKEHAAATKKMLKAQKVYADAMKEMAQDVFDYETKLFEQKLKRTESPKVVAAGGAPTYTDDELAGIFGEDMVEIIRQQYKEAVTYQQAEAAIAAAAEKHTIVMEELHRREAAAEGLVGGEKIQALKELQSFRLEYAEQYVSETGRIVRAEEAHKEALADVEDWQRQIIAIHEVAVGKAAAAAAAETAAVQSIAAEMAAAENVVAELNGMVADLHRELSVGVTMSNTKQALAEVKKAIDEIPDITYKTIVVRYQGEGAPVKSFPEGGEQARKKTDSPAAGESAPKASAQGAGAGSSSFNASITVNAGGGADGKALARDMEREMAHRWKTGRSQLRVAMETR